ncbi:MAG: exo-alpha-sialidase [Bacteroidales bacterium]|nr:exo-alpha-sialidase [Bacteroidales bacterium]
MEIPATQERAPRIPLKDSIIYSEVYHVKGRFAAWPANNGAWHFKDNDQVLVGFTSGAYNKDASGHKISDTERKSSLATSIDGGATWTSRDPENYVGDESTKSPLKEPINFTNPGFAMRVAGAAYHGTEDSEGRFYYSYDRGQTWNGPYPLGNIHRQEELKGKVITARTDYIVLGKYECLLMISAKPGDDLKGESGPMTDKVLCIKTTDGGKSFESVSWVVPLSDPYRAVMPNTVKVGDDHLVTVLRRKTLDTEECWIDAYGSTDGGNTWQFLSRIAETGVMNNGNPPAIALLKDGSLCTVYGNRDKRMILGKYSVDGGHTWGEEFVVRQNEEDYPDADLGYPRLVCRNDGSLLAIYYWVSKENPVQYVESATWKP